MAFSQEDYDFYFSKFERTGIEVINFKSIKQWEESEIPVLCVGRDTSNDFVDYEHVCSILDDKEKSFSKVNQFISKSAFEFRPFQKITFDAILNIDVFDFINSEINEDDWRYLYFYNKALYIFSPGKLLCISLESLDFVGKDVAQIVKFILTHPKTIVLSYDNVAEYIFEDFEPLLLTAENILWTRFHDIINLEKIYSFFGDTKLPYIIPYILYEFFEISPLTYEEELSAKRFYIKDIATHWLNKQMIFLSAIPNNKIKFIDIDGQFFVKPHYSNKRTLTGRINCVDSNFNPQMLPKSSPIREFITSRYNGGKIVVFDYISFETTLSIYVTGDTEFINKMHNKDMHEETGKLIFDTDKINSEQRVIGKLFNHTLLYGGGEEKLKEVIQNYSDKQYEFNFENIFSRIREIYAPIFQKIEEIQGMYSELKYIINPYLEIIRPNKSWAAYNNFIQSTAVNIVVNKLLEIRKFLLNQQIHLLFQVHDSFVFDFAPGELKRIPEITRLLSQVHKVTFPIESKVGDTLLDITIDSEPLSEEDLVK